MRVAFDARMVHYRRAGGIGQYTLSLLEAMARAPEIGSEAEFYVLQMRGHTRPIVQGDPRFRRVPMVTPAHNRFEQPALGLELLRLLPPPQVIHSPDFVPPRYRLCRAVVNIHDLAFLKIPEMTLLTEESKRYYGQVDRAARDADAIIALSGSARGDIITLLGVEPSRVAVIPAAAGEAFSPPGDYAAAQEEAARLFGLPGPGAGGYILTVGTIEPRKNLPTLLEAYRILLDRGRVAREGGAAPALVVAGREGWLTEKVYERIEALRLKERVHLLKDAEAESLPALYRGARLFALPSLYEGFGLPALEALACAAPVLSSDRGSLPEVVGKAGVLLDPLDAQAWAEAMERTLFDPAEQERLRAAGPQQAAHFSWHRAAVQTWELYRRVAQRA